MAATVRVYRIDYRDAFEGVCVRWAWNATAADAVLNEVLTFPNTERGSIEITRVDFPTDQTGIVRWLNINLKRNNG